MEYERRIVVIGNLLANPKFINGSLSDFELAGATDHTKAAIGHALALREEGLLESTLLLLDHPFRSDPRVYKKDLLDPRYSTSRRKVFSRAPCVGDLHPSLSAQIQELLANSALLAADLGTILEEVSYWHARNRLSIKSVACNLLMAASLDLASHYEIQMHAHRRVPRLSPVKVDFFYSNRGGTGLDSVVEAIDIDLPTSFGHKTNWIVPYYKAYDPPAEEEGHKPDSC